MPDVWDVMFCFRCGKRSVFAPIDDERTLFCCVKCRAVRDLADEDLHDDF